MMNEYNYETWLAGHASRKSMMEKLERSLIPYELFALMPLKSGHDVSCGNLTFNANVYRYSVRFDYEHFGSRVYDVEIECVDLKRPWANPLMGYSRFKVVMDGERITTIYTAENFFQQVLDAFEREDVDFLARHRGDYVRNLLARYIMLRLLADRSSGQQLLSSIETSEGNRLTAICSNANRSSLILYAFTMEEAIETARRYDGLAKNLTFVYFLNRDFERRGNTATFKSPTTRVLSVHGFCRSLALDTDERLYAERKILFLAAFLYQETLDLEDLRRVEQIVSRPPYFGIKPRDYKEGRKRYRNQFYGRELRFSRMLSMSLRSLPKGNPTSFISSARPLLSMPTSTG